MTNFYVGLFRGAIGPRVANTELNATAAAAINMGACVKFAAPTSSELLPRVEEVSAITDLSYGIVVAGDADGVYTDAASPTAENQAASAAGESVNVVTQGRCLARINGAVTVGQELAATTDGRLQAAVATQVVIARALQATGGAGNHLAAVDVQREGIKA